VSSTAARLGRVYRLCQKELRESLRDRRTIVTLVLMPLLVYPLLSMILQRLLLTGEAAGTDQEIRVGILEQPVAPQLGSWLRLALDVVERDGGETLQVVSGDGAHLQQFRTLAERLVLIPVGGNTREALKTGIVDVVVRAVPPDAVPPDAVPRDAVPRDAVPRDAVPRDAAPRDAVPRDAAPPGVPGTLLSDRGSGNSDSDAAGTVAGRAGVGPAGADRAELGGEPLRGFRYEIDYVAQDRASERALRFLQSVFATVNEEAMRAMAAQAGVRVDRPLTMLAAPVKIDTDSPSMLAALVPLVLVLMTIAGAVYPAIDLTAGERERGTLEAIIVSPTARPLLLLAKYVAVVTVALLTALANLLAMSITLWASGLGRWVFGSDTLPLVTILQILMLLVLLAMFFSAVLLAITSFAKSFKEAQAYLIPVMLISLAPGVLSLLPQVRLTNLLATVPLANIVLLARDLLTGGVTWEIAVTVVLCTAVYALAAIAVASRLFGSDASLQGSQGSWRDWLQRPATRSAYPAVDQVALAMACMFPLYFVGSTTLPRLGGTLDFRLLASAVVSWALIFGLPTLIAAVRRIDFRSTFLLTAAPGWLWLAWLPAIVLLGGSLWMFAHELMLWLQWLGIATFGPEQFEQAQKFAEQLPQSSLWVVLFAGALTPALCEEWFFRGFVMSAFRPLGKWPAIVFSALLFGLMHVLTSNVVAVERFFPSAGMGLVLGWVAWRTGSLLPGVILHALHNGFLLSVGYYKDTLLEWGLGVQEGMHLPLAWLAGGVVASALGFVILHWTTARGASAVAALSARTG
jgi:sodium transport system permease protein